MGEGSTLPQLPWLQSYPASPAVPQSQPVRWEVGRERGVWFVAKGRCEGHA